MTRCCSTSAYAEVFNEKTARDDAARYRRRGLDPLERKVVALIASRGLEGGSVLEVGGGVGTIALELVRAGASRATNVELSPAYEDQARSLLREHGLEERVDRRIGDIVGEPGVPAADVVVLHKVVCCYPDGAALMRAAAARTRRVLAVTFPRTSWWVRLALVGDNALSALRGTSFRAFVHSEHAVIGTATAEGLRVAYDRQGILWRTVVLERT